MYVPFLLHIYKLILELLSNERLNVAPHELYRIFEMIKTDSMDSMRDWMLCILFCESVIWNEKSLVSPIFIRDFRVTKTLSNRAWVSFSICPIHWHFRENCERPKTLPIQCPSSSLPCHASSWHGGSGTKWWPVNEKRLAFFSEIRTQCFGDLAGITWAFDRPRAAAISSRSAGDKYFWYRKRFSNSKIWWLVNAVRDFRFFFGCGRDANKLKCDWSEMIHETNNL